VLLPGWGVCRGKCWIVVFPYGVRRRFGEHAASSDDGSACANGTVAGYLGTSCSQTGTSGTTVYQWISYSCASTPASICTALGANGSHVQMTMDPNGPYTILVGQTSLWNVAAGQTVDVTIAGTVYGAINNGNWPHFNGLNGQAGDGSEENKTTVACAAAGKCLDANMGVSDVLCNATSAASNCTEQSTIGPYGVYQAGFTAATSTSPYGLTIEVKLNGGATGSATLYSVGTHLVP
jgi:hypothetical protein